MLSQWREDEGEEKVPVGLWGQLRAPQRRPVCAPRAGKRRQLCARAGRGREAWGVGRGAWGVPGFRPSSSSGTWVLGRPRTSRAVRSGLRNAVGRGRHVSPLGRSGAGRDVRVRILLRRGARQSSAAARMLAATPRRCRRMNTEERVAGILHAVRRRSSAGRRRAGPPRW